MSTYQAKLQFIDEEIGRLLSQAQDPLDKLNAKIAEAVAGTLVRGEARIPVSAAEVAADNLAALVHTTARVRVFSHYIEAIGKNRENGSTDEDTFNRIEKYLNNALISAVSYQNSQNTSWAVDVQRRVELVALGDVARLFQDVRRL